MSENIINIVCCEKLKVPRLEYIIAFLNHHPLKPAKALLTMNYSGLAQTVISYSAEKRNGLWIPWQDLFFSLQHVSSSGLFVNSYSFNELVLYSVENHNKEISDFLIENKFGFDIFETIFYHISRYEEVFAADHQKDEHLRVKTSGQLLVRNGLHHTPVVDALVLAFFRALGFNIKDRISGFSMTHDIDAIHKFNGILKLPKSVIRVIMMGLGLKGVLSIISYYFKSLLNKDHDPYYVFDTMLVSDDVFSDKIIFFVSGGKTRFDLFNINYNRWLPVVIAKAIKKGYSIGYHPSYSAYNDHEMFHGELALLRKSVGRAIEHVRTHFLRMDFNSTFNIASENSISIDSTLGFPDEIGFRCGTGFRYFLYDFAKENQSEIRELPLIIMDSALLYIYCNEITDCFKEKLFQFIEKNKFNTHITLNFHNSTFDRSLKTRSGMINIYSELITDISNFNLKILTS